MSLDPAKSPTPSLARAIVQRTRGRANGPATRLMNPSDVGEILKPFGCALDAACGTAAGSTKQAARAASSSGSRCRPNSNWVRPKASTKPLKMYRKTVQRAFSSAAMGVPDKLGHGDLAAFEPSSAAVEFEARTDVEFVLGSAAAHKYELVLGSHSVHTTPAALRDAQAHISKIRTRLVQEGRL